MKYIWKIKRRFRIAVVSLCLMSTSILFMPMAVQRGETNRVILLLLGIVFWSTAICGYGALLLANTERRRFLKNKMKMEPEMNRHCGILTFFSNVWATFADVTVIVSSILMLIINGTDLRYEYISYVMLFIWVLSLNMHCLFNGRIYKTTKLKPTRRKSDYE